MKNFLLTIILFAFVVKVSAQIEVQSSGQVGIGTSNPQHKLHVAGNAYATGNLYLGSSASNFLGTTGNFPVVFKVENILAGFTGSHTQGNVSFGYGAFAIGYLATATGSYQVRIGNSGVGSIGGYANWSNISDSRAKKNIKADVPGLAFINLLQPVTYHLDLDAMDNLLGIDRAKKDELEKDVPRDLKDQNAKAKKAKEDQVQTGFVAQDVEKTAKSIGYDFSGVEVDESGIYALRYAEFVVPLVKAVQELSEQNERLQAQINELLQEKGTSLRSGNAGESATGLPELSGSVATLQQNRPNPFREQTEIRYFLPDNIRSAYVCIFDMQGKMLKKLDAAAGAHTLVIKGSELRAGMYLYALIADGKEVDTKRMILTK